MLFSPTLHRRLAGLTLVALACLAASAPAQAQWKWRDSRGQVHVSDIPPPRDIPDKDVMQRPEVVVRKPVAAAAPASAASAAPAKAAVDPELEERRRRAEQDQSARAKADEQKAAAIRKDNCQRAREQLATVESGQRIARVKADGEREILDDEARAKEARRARDVIASDCR
jgi:uncharacterized protein YfaQ (DUF2300 family)